MDFKSSPLGSLYYQLRQTVPKDIAEDFEILNECELRADSKKPNDLRVVTGKESLRSSTKRLANQRYAIDIVKGYFEYSLEKIINENDELPISHRDGVRARGQEIWAGEIRGLRTSFLTAGSLRKLHERAVKFVESQCPKQNRSLLFDSHNSNDSDDLEEEKPVILHTAPVSKDQPQ